LLRIAERTNSYFIPIRAEEVVGIELEKDKSKMYLNLIIKNGSSIRLWGVIDQYVGWEAFIESSFLR